MYRLVDGLGILPVYFANIEAGDVENEHIRVSIMPTSPEEITLCDGNKWTWILQIAVYVRDGVGEIKAAQYVDSIRAAITKNMSITENSRTFTVANSGERIPPVIDGGWYFTPLQYRIRRIE
jgi:hypothetical protein